MSRIKWVDLDEPGLSTPVLQVLEKFGFELMTPVQTAAIRLLLARKDVCAEAVTGSGKTLAFLVPLLEMLQRRNTPWQANEIGAVIISPTRELATQISEVLAQFLEHEQLQHFKQQLIIGGNSIDEDIATLQRVGPTILVCTPGRLEDLFQRKCNLNLAARVKSLEFLVLDEADRLLDLGFKNSINNILNYLPRQRRTGLFSATQTTEVTDLIRAGLRNPVLVSVKEKSSINTPVCLQNFFKIVEADEKFIALLNFLRTASVAASKIMLFLPTCACVEYWAAVLPHFLNGRCVLSMHGKMKNKRKFVVERFRRESAAILLCTDVLARGLDVPDVEWVVQWDAPASAASFVHRVGRTARQGNTGNALVLLLPSEDAYVTFLKINQKVELTELSHVQQHNKSDLQPTLEKLHQLQLRDRAICDKAIRAFVSHVRAYSKHECNAILRMKDLDLGKMATGYGLLQMPRMPELRQQSTDSFIGPSVAVDISKLSYKNPQKQAVHNQKLQTYEQTGEWPGKKQHKKSAESWEQTKKAKMDAKKKKELRKAKKQRRNADNAGPKAKKSKQQFTHEELEELANDLRVLKKVKRNKITEEEYDKEMGLDCNNGS